MCNGTGNFELGTGRYYFTAEVDQQKRLGYLRFYIREQGFGDWDIEEVNAGLFHLTLRFEEKKYSPFRSTDPITFKIHDPFSLEKMKLLLLPDADDQDNEMSLNKIIK
jgi:hypothetical protein